MKVIKHAVETRSYKECTDTELFKIMANKDHDSISAQKAFAEIDLRYRKYVWKICTVFTKSREMALEVLKDTLYKAFLNAGNYKSNKNTKAWLGTMARNAIFDIKKGAKNEIPVVLDEYPNTASEPQEEVAWGTRMPVEKGILISALNALDEHKREVLESYLRYFDISEFGDGVRLPDYEVQLLCSTYPTIIKSKYYIPKIRDRAWIELYDTCMKHIQN